LLSRYHVTIETKLARTVEIFAVVVGLVALKNYINIICNTQFEK